jgi:hypothetical protein
MKEALMHYYRVLVNKHDGSGVPKTGLSMYYMILPVLLTQALNTYVQGGNVMSDVFLIFLCNYIAVQYFSASTCLAVWTPNIIFHLLDVTLFKMGILNVESLNSWPMLAAGIITVMAFACNMDMRAKEKDSNLT